MRKIYTAEELEQLPREKLIEIILSLQEELIASEQEHEARYNALEKKFQLLMEQFLDLQRQLFGRSTEKLPPEDEPYADTEDYSVLNEAEAISDAETKKEKKRGVKRQGKRADDLKGIPVQVENHDIPEDELKKLFPDGYKRLPDDIIRTLERVPAHYFVKEIHIAVYSDNFGDTLARADHPKKLFRNSLASVSLVVEILISKYFNAMPLYRQETYYKTCGLEFLTRKTLADWVINSADRYWIKFYEKLVSELLKNKIIQADQTPVLVNKDGRPAGRQSSMWVYRTGFMNNSPPVVIYEYQMTKEAKHASIFLKDYQGICITDGDSSYHAIENGKITIAGCWAHARRRYDEALKTLHSGERNSLKGSLAKKALRLIQAIYKADKALKDLNSSERLEQRQDRVEPLVDAYFAWVRETKARIEKEEIVLSNKLKDGLNYSLHQEKYLRVFLSNGDVPMDNNASERAIRPFCVGKRNWLFCDTISGAQASAVSYSIAETVKANNLNPTNYLEYVLTALVQHQDEEDESYLDDMMPWSKNLPENCYNPKKN